MALTILFTGLVGALLGGFVTASFHIWKLRRDELNSRCDEVCKVILDCSSAASEYWADDYHDRTKEMRIAEARIMGLQSLFEGLYGELKLRLDVDEADEIDQLMSGLLDAVSGGEFTVERRPPDPIRTRGAPQAAAAVVAAIRKAHHNTMPFAALGRIVDASRHRRLDMPRHWKDS